ncbi:MAG TPA: PPOX class F420-dependent oxidoreductase [Mycobacteriales bacterium]|nr:PPOX class F420-dependent oxidoreductase [Mycobacteriales bacterium]
MGSNQRAQIVLTDEEVAELLAGSRTATMATVGADGQPHLVAMWFAVLDGDVCFETKAKSQKAVNLRRDPRISVLVEDGITYEDLRGVSLEGRAEVSDDPDLLWRIGVDIWERYYGPYTDEMQPFVEAMLNKRVAVRVKAERVRSWDHRKLGMPATGGAGGSTMSAPGRRPR